MTEATLYEIVDSISPQKSRQSALYKMKGKPWTREEQLQFERILSSYGQDLSILECYFPKRTQRQLKKKCKQILVRLKYKNEKDEHARKIQRRKSFFDEQILEQKFANKTNNSSN